MLEVRHRSTSAQRRLHYTSVQHQVKSYKYMLQGMTSGTRRTPNSYLWTDSMLKLCRRNGIHSSLGIAHPWTPQTPTTSYISSTDRCPVGWARHAHI